MMKKTGLVFGLFLIWLPRISAESACCESLKYELERKTQDYEKLCPSECEGRALLFNGDTSDYAISKDDRASPIAAITACLWVKSTQTTIGSFVSYAVATHHNEFVFYTYYATNVRMIVVGKILTRNNDIIINDGKCHHVCATWQSEGGLYEIYKDGQLAASGSITGTSGETISEGGSWVVGQEQDHEGGGFSPKQAFVGEMNAANVWDKVLSAQEILEMSQSCKAIREGNVKSWNDFLSGVRGYVKIVKPTCGSNY